MKTRGIALLLIVATICGRAFAEPPTDSKPNAATDAPKAIPAEYRTLANIVCQPIRMGNGTPQPGRTLSQLIADAQGNVMDLRKIHSDDDDINQIAASAIEAVDDVTKRLEALDIASMSKPKQESAINGADVLLLVPHLKLLSLVAEAANAQQKQNAKNQTWKDSMQSELAHLVGDSHKLEADAILLDKIASKYSAPTVPNDPKIEIGFVAGWVPGADVLGLTNRGADLEDCTIRVELVGTRGESQINVHFVPKWAANTVVAGIYSRGVSVLGQTLDRATVEQPKSVTVSIQSPSFSTRISYTCDQDKMVADICRNLKLNGRYVENKNAILTAHKYVAAITMDGVAFLPKGQITLTIKADSKRWRPVERQYQFDTWTKGETKILALPFKPESTDVTLNFDNTGYHYQTTFSE